MNSLLLNSATTSVVFEGPVLMRLFQMFRGDLSKNNEEFATYLEESVKEVFFEAHTIELINVTMTNYFLEASFRIVFDGIKSPEIIEEYLISFDTLKECMHFSESIKSDIKSKLLKYQNKYYFHITEPLTLNIEEKIIENLATVVFDPLIITRILEHANVVIDSYAIRKLGSL